MIVIDILLAAPDFLVKKIIIGGIKILFSFCMKYLNWRKKLTNDQGRFLIDDRVVYQQSSVDFLNGGGHVSRIRDFPDFLHDLLMRNVEEKYRTAESDDRGFKRTIFRVNGCRISTFFVFTDGEHVVVHNRMSSDPGLQRIANAKFDMIGSVNFENVSMFGKISDEAKFFDSKPIEIELIPGFAFEDTTEVVWNELFYPKTAVVMVGLCIKLASDDLKKVRSINGKSLIEITRIHELPAEDVMTSKAKLAAGYLRKKYPRTKMPIVRNLIEQAT